MKKEIMLFIIDRLKLDYLCLRNFQLWYDQTIFLYIRHYLLYGHRKQWIIHWQFWYKECVNLNQDFIFHKKGRGPHFLLSLLIWYMMNNYFRSLTTFVNIWYINIFLYVNIYLFLYVNIYLFLYVNIYLFLLISCKIRY